MRSFCLQCLCLAVLFSRNLTNCTIAEEEEPRRTFPIRRAIDGTRGRKYYDPEVDSTYDDYGSSNGRYNPYEDETDLSDIRDNVPGEPGVDYPAYSRLPQTEFVCEAHYRGYYADEAAGCQVFHVCDGSFLVSSFLCPVGSIFSQKLLTCDWWNKVDCSLTRNYHVINVESHVSEVDDDEILRKAFEMSRVRSAGERIPAETVIEEQDRPGDRRNQRVFKYTGNTVTERTNHLPTGRESYSDYPDYPSRHSSRYKATTNTKNRQQYQGKDYYSGDVGTDERNSEGENPSIKIYTIGQDRKNDRQGSLRNEFQASYAPTVPTVTTLAKRFYSPTVPTTYRPPTTRNAFDRYDLEFESSDHLYTARGRSEEIVKAATPAPISTKNNNQPVDSSSTTFSNIKNDVNDIEKSEIPHGPTQLPIDSPAQNSTDVQSLNATIESLDRKEKIITQDLDRLSEKITETLSILTIGDENRDPNVFSYNHEEDARSRDRNVEHSPEPSGIPDSTNSSASGISGNVYKPAEFLIPPKENQDEFRIMIPDEFSTGKNESLFSNPDELSGQNITHEIQSTKAPASTKKSQSPNDGNKNRESRIFRIIIGNNTVDSESSEELKTPKIVIERVKSIDLSPDSFASAGTFIGTSVIPENSEKIVQSVDASSFNLTKSIEFLPTTFSPENSSREIELPQTVDSIELVQENIKDNDSRRANNLTSIERDSTLSPSENVLVTQPISHDREVPSNASKIGDAIELSSSPIEFTLSVNKNQKIDPNGEEIRELIAQPEIGDSIGAADFKSFEIVRSDEHNSSPPDLESDGFNNQNSKTESTQNGNGNLRIPQGSEFESMKYLQSFVSSANGPNVPRPFSLEQTVISKLVKASSNAEDKTISTSSPSFSGAPEHLLVSGITDASDRSTEELNAEENLETLKTAPSGLTTDLEKSGAVSQLSQIFGRRNPKTDDSKLVFDLPESTRLYNFETGLPLDDSEKSSPRIEQEHRTQRSNETNEETQEVHTETVIKTEFIPSLGFSLNTDEEREEYMEAVVKGLLHDVTTANTTNHESNTSIES
ncbi:uncharacterized protein [Venturia canescens]|uniref:uncharacterized protein n=1 Tax=Venturia canescens TaxID=32260 RepID=UPI001C9CC4C7|nr:uncharacterized protein LOC122416372 [Venturia canescens]